MPLSTKQMEYLALAWQCFETEPKVPLDLVPSATRPIETHLTLFPPDRLREIQDRRRPRLRRLRPRADARHQEEAQRGVRSTLGLNDRRQR